MTILIGTSCLTLLGKWVLALHGSSGFSFLLKPPGSPFWLNGEPVGFFPAEKCLREGDSLSPFLFIIDMEGLDNLMRRASSKQLDLGFQNKKQD